MEFYKDDPDQNSTFFPPNFVSNNQNIYNHTLPSHPKNVFQNPLYFSHQTLDSAFSSLNLSPEKSPSPSFLPFSGEHPLSQRRLLPSSTNNDVSLRSLRFQEGQMGSGVGPRNLIVGPQGFPINTPPASVPAPSLLCNRSSVLGGLDFLISKKQRSPHYANTQFLAHDLTLYDMRGSIIYLANNQHFSKILQEKFLNPSPQEIEMVLSEVIDSIGDLMQNQFGNDFVKKLVGSCNENQRTMIILSVTKSVLQFLSVCRNPHGTRGMQMLMEYVSSPHQVSLLMAAISPSAVILATDTNGHHVIQQCLKHFSDEYTMHILDNIASNCFEVATSRTGCCVMQSCVEKSVGKPRQHLVSEIIAIAVHLAEHPFGNYVLQHLLSLEEPDITSGIVIQLEGNYVPISCNKYGSNVVEKCLIESSAEQCTKIIMELVSSPNASMILLDPFGNFVIQCALSVSKGHTRSALLKLVRTNASSMKNNLYGKKIIAWLERRRFI